MRIQFTFNGKVIEQREAYCEPNMVMIGQSFYDGVDFDRTEFEIGGVAPKSGCWSLFECAQVLINEGDEYERDFELIDFDRDPKKIIGKMGFRLVNEGGSAAMKDDVSRLIGREV